MFKLTYKLNYAGDVAVLENAVYRDDVECELWWDGESHYVSYIVDKVSDGLYYIPEYIDYKLFDLEIL